MEENNESGKEELDETLKDLAKSTIILDKNDNSVITGISLQQQEQPKKKMTAIEWFAEMGWRGNPFTFSILPELLVGYKDEIDRLMLAIEERHKFVYLAGPTGSGKTTLMKWIAGHLPKDFDVLYIAKPPEKAETFVELLNAKYRRSRFAFWKNGIKNLYDIPDFLNKKQIHLIMLFDEAHESNLDVLEWLRVLSDQVNNMSVVLSGLPVFESHLKDKLETFRKRIAAKIELVSLTKEETTDMIRKRIQYVGGTGNEFSQEIIDFIFTQSGGFPREVLRICDELVNHAILSGKKEFIRSAAAQEEVVTKMSLNIIEDMTPMQKEVVEMLAKNPMTPGEIANATNLSKYKSRQHAVRSINNIMKKLYEDGYLERRRSDKAYIYSLSGKLRTIVVKT